MTTHRANRRRTLGRHHFDVSRALSALGQVDRVLICPHDDPDPDALAAAWGMAVLLEHGLCCECTIAFAGIIGRAENRAMVRELDIKLRRREHLDLSSFDGVVLVDTQPGARNHSVPPSMRVLGCVDHHPALPTDLDIPWFDVSPDGGTTSSIVLCYLIEQKVPVSTSLATAIAYAIKTDTRDLSRDASQCDFKAFDYAFRRADRKVLGSIVNPKLPARYFNDLRRAIEFARVHDKAVLLFLKDLEYPDLTAEMADLFVRQQKIQWCLCAGDYKGRFRISLRCEDAAINAGLLAHRLVECWRGSAGGHDSTAGGEIPLPAGTRADQLESLWSGISRDFLEAIGAPLQGSALTTAE